MRILVKDMVIGLDVNFVGVGNVFGFERALSRVQEAGPPI